MNKKILIGCIIAVVILLLMPSIPAIQYKTIEENSFDDYLKNHFEIEIKDLKKNIQNVSWKYPVMWVVMLLFRFVVCFRLLRGFYFLWESAYNWFNPDEYLKITKPVIFLRGCWLYFTSIGLIDLIVLIDEKMGWRN